MKFLMLLGSAAIVLIGFRVQAALLGKPGSGPKSLALLCSMLCLLYAQWALYSGYRNSPAQVEYRRLAAAELERVERERDCSQSSLAFVMSQNFVKRGLVSPTSAVFPTSASIARAEGNCKFTVVSYVDSQNALGATLRTPYTAVLEYLPGSREWKLISLVM